jgi:hypothetical protein
MAMRVLVKALCVAALSTCLLPAAAGAQTPHAERVIVVLAPYLSWQDVTPTSTPTMWSMARSGAIGDINARSRVREQGEPPSPLEGALTISAGSWAVPSFMAPAAYDVDERYEVGTAAEAFRRMTGAAVGTNRIVFLGMPMTQRLNTVRAPDLLLGTLGQAVKDAGGATAAIGNSDVGYTTGEQRQVRPAALAAMDEAGLVEFGDVSQHMLREDPQAPFGIETDVAAFARAYDDADAQLQQHGGPQLIVLDPGDSYRATKFAPEIADSIVSKQRIRAFKTLDRIVAMARDRAGKRGIVMVVSQSLGYPPSGKPEGLGPIIVSGAGWSGYVVSSSTQRTGLVTNMDVTATALDALGITRPVQVNGNPVIPVKAAASLDDRVRMLVDMDATAVAVDSAKPSIVNTFVTVTVIVLLTAAVVLVRSKYWSQIVVRRWVAGLRSVLLLVLSVPAASWLMFALWSRPATQAVAVSVFLVTLALLWGIALLVARKLPLRAAVAVVSLMTSAIILVDQWLGAPFSFTNFFGYSPLLAARFYGMGNEAAAVLVGSSITGLALLFDQWPNSKWTKLGKRFGVPVVGILVVVTSAAPFLGANVGVAIWGLIGFAFAWVLMNGHHVSWKAVFWMGVAVVAVIAAFAAIDMFGGGAQTHLARSLMSAEQGGVKELWIIVARKAATNTRVLTHTNWAYILIAVLAFLGFMRWRPQGDFADTLIDSPDFADAITASLISGLVAYFTEDSGIVIPALIELYVGIGIVWLMISRLGSSSMTAAEKPAASEAEGGR